MRLAIRENMVLEMMRGTGSEGGSWAAQDEALACKTRELGFNTIEVGLRLVDPEMTTERCRELRDIFADQGVTIAQMWSDNSPLVRPSKVERQKNLARFRGYMRIAKDLGVKYVVIAPGSFHATNYWGSHPNNESQQALDLLIDQFEEAAKTAEDYGIYMAPECHNIGILNTPLRVRQLMSRVDSPSMRVNFDPVNLMRLENVYHTTEALDYMFDLYDSNLAGGHAKDVYVAEDKVLVVRVYETYAGNGQLDYHTFLKRFNAQAEPEAPLCIEHTRGEDVLKAKAYIEDIAEEEGIAFL